MATQRRTDTSSPGVVWRSSALSPLGEDGNQALADARIRTLIDLREPTEQAKQPVDLIRPGIELRTFRMINGGEFPESAHTVDGFCRWMIAERGERLAGLLSALSRSETHPIVMFCSSGKDRTGVASGLLLSALGVSDDDVAEDFHRTETVMPPEHAARAIELSLTLGVDPEVTRVNLTAPRQLMRDVLAEVREQHGSASGYLLQHGLADDELAQLRRSLVTY